MVQPLEKKLTIDLPYHDPDNFPLYRDVIAKKTQELLDPLVKAVCKSNAFATDLKYIMDDFTHEGFWHTLPLIVIPPAESRYLKNETATKNRTRVLANLQPHVRQEILNVLVNQARVPKYNSGRPGSDYGHSILLATLNKSPDVTLTNPQISLLSTVSLFESLPDYNRGRTSDVHGAIDNLADGGLDMHALKVARYAYNRNVPAMLRGRFDDFTLHGIPSNYLVELSRLVGQAHYALKDSEFSQGLAIPIVKALFSLDDDDDRDVPFIALRNSKKPHNSTFAQAATQPWIIDTLNASQSVREAYSAGMHDLLCKRSYFSCDGSYIDGINVLKSLPDPSIITAGYHPKIRANIEQELGLSKPVIIS